MVDWSRAIKEKLYIKKSYIERIIYRDETNTCKNCSHFSDTLQKCDVFPRKTWNGYFMACVQYDNSND